MKRILSHIALVGALAMGLVACGGSGVTRPYDEVDVTPDSVAGDVAYYSYTLVSVGGATYPALFSTKDGHWNWKTLAGTSWNVLKPELILWTAEGYTNAGATEFVSEMGHTIVTWTPQVNYIVKLDADATDSLPADVPLLNIIKAYMLRPDLFSGVFPR